MALPLGRMVAVTSVSELARDVQTVVTHKAGGRVVVAGTPEAVVKSRSHTGVALKPLLRR